MEVVPVEYDHLDLAPGQVASGAQSGEDPRSARADRRSARHVLPLCSAKPGADPTGRAENVRQARQGLLVVAGLELAVGVHPKLRRPHRLHGSYRSSTTSMNMWVCTWVAASAAEPTRRNARAAQARQSGVPTGRSGICFGRAGWSGLH
jgi:hypothetical protein